MAPFAADCEGATTKSPPSSSEVSESTTMLWRRLPASVPAPESSSSLSRFSQGSGFSSLAEESGLDYKARVMGWGQE
jgi:hypothetical protein